MKLKLLVCFVVVMTSCFAGVKVVLFDLDGTLVNSEYAHYLAWNRALKDYGTDLSFEDYRPFLGKTAEANAPCFAAMAGAECNSETLLKAKTEYYHELYSEEATEITPTVQFLRALAEQKETLGLKVGICSAAHREEILFYAKKLQIDHMLDIVLSGGDDLNEYSDPEGVNKPKPYIYLHAMKILGTLPEETVVIEDSITGAKAGVAAGCFTIAIPNDFSKLEDFSFTNWRIDSFEGMQIDQFLDRTSCTEKIHFFSK